MAGENSGFILEKNEVSHNDKKITPYRLLLHFCTYNRKLKKKNYYISTCPPHNHSMIRKIMLKAPTELFGK